ncbi:MAG TPA: helicase-associated domain-containing protein, partial [Isosphaeraceae bacterium]|nr:helicase-associated domain-containing protein [Isosphaeraceae bacterium]
MSLAAPEPEPEPVPEPEPEPVPDAYREALRARDATSLAATLLALGEEPRGRRPAALADAIADRLAEPGAVRGVLETLPPGARLALGLFPMVDEAAWPVAGLGLGVRCLGVEPMPAIAALIASGLLVNRAAADGHHDVIPHPSALAAARPALPIAEGPPKVSRVAQVREADGLEPILRLAALWQRVDELPLRQTQQGSLYKRDRERLEDDPALAGTIADALEPLPDMVPLWLSWARGVGLIAPEADSDRIVAAPASSWPEHAADLPASLAARWLGARAWHERVGMQDAGAETPLALPFVRPAALLWLATLDGDEWLAVDDLAAHFDRLAPGWDRAGLAGPPVATHGGDDLIAAMLLGPAYQLGLVRAAEEAPGGRRVARLTDLGRSVLGLGPAPRTGEVLEKFLYIQPNFEVIAYRQGLSPLVIGHLTRFVRWSRLGGAIELRLTPESVYRGLEGGLSPEQMLDRLALHAARPLPPGVAGAVRTWASRRERVAYHADATLIEFATAEALEAALADWPADGRPAPERVAERLVLVEDPATIPWDRFRLAGSRSYRQEPETCVEVEPDGVTLALDLGRSDLFVDAELARVADELPRASPSRRQFRVTAETLARAAAEGMAAAQLERWFERRAGTGLPPAIRLLLHAMAPRPAPFATSRPVVLHAPTPELLD